MSEQSTIHIVLRKDKQYGRTLYYTTKKEDVWLPLIHNQQSLTQHNIDYLKKMRDETGVTPVWLKNNE